MSKGPKFVTVSLKEGVGETRVSNGEFDMTFLPGVEYSNLTDEQYQRFLMNQTDQKGHKIFQSHRVSAEEKEKELEKAEKAAEKASEKDAEKASEHHKPKKHK